MRTETNFTQRTLRIQRVAEKTSLAVSSIWRLAQQGKFPLPVKLSPGCTVWYEHEIDEFLDAKAAERGFLVALTDSGEPARALGESRNRKSERVS